MAAQELRESCLFENTTHSVKDGKYVVAGQFSKADLRNENGRVYRRSMWENVLHRPYIIDALNKRKMLGELGHPEKIETTLKEVSHIVTKLEMKPDGEIYGEAEILDTPNGQILKTLYEAGVQLGISSRGYLPEGSNLFAEGEDLIVPDDYELITFDFVIDPSSQGAEPTKVSESTKQKLTTILTESKGKVSSDVVSYIEGLNVIKEDIDTNGKVLSESLDKNSDNLIHSNQEDKTSMDAYTEKLEGVVGELKNRYLTAESVINDFVKERKNADAVLKGVTNRYLTAEQAVTGLRDYSLKLEETVDEVVSLYRTSEQVISQLRDQCNLSEQVINDLKNRYTLSENVIKELAKSYKVAESIVNTLRDRYTLSEAVLKEFAGRYSVAEAALSEMANRMVLSEAVIAGLKDRLVSARKANISLKKQLEESVDSNIKDTEINESNEELASLKEKCRLQDEEIASLKKELESKNALTESKAVEPKKVPVPNSYFEDCAVKYNVSVQECKNIFKAMGCRKNAFEFHMNEMRRAIKNNRYSEFPYMVDGSTASKALTESGKHHEVDRIARLVEGAF